MLLHQLVRTWEGLGERDLIKSSLFTPTSILPLVGLKGGQGMENLTDGCAPPLSAHKNLHNLLCFVKSLMQTRALRGSTEARGNEVPPLKSISPSGTC
jgi:hypothetical protein